MTIEDDDALVSKLADLTAAELLEAVGRAAGQRMAEEKKQLAADAVREYIAKGDIAGLGEHHPLNASALELERQRQDKEQNDE